MWEHQVVLHVRQVLEQTAERHRRGTDRRSQAGRVDAGALPRQRRAQEVEEAEEGRRLVCGQRRLRAALLVDLGHARGR